MELENPAAVLAELCTALEIDIGEWERQESARHLRGSVHVSPQAAAGLNLAQVQRFVNAYDPGLETAEFHGDGGIKVLVLRDATSDAVIEVFRSDIEDAEELTFELTINKHLLLDAHNAQVGLGRSFIFFFDSAFRDFINSNLAHLEAELWSKDDKALLLVPQSDLLLDGDLLAIVGGRYLANWTAITPSAPDVSARITSFLETRQNNLIWDDNYLKRLTPLHFYMARRDAVDNATLVSLQVHLGTLVIMYTADRVSFRNGRYQATYENPSEPITVLANIPGELSGQDLPDATNSLYGIVKWAYETPGPVVNKLQIAQTVIGQTLGFAEPPLRFKLLLTNSDAISKSVQRHWRMMLDDRVSSHFAKLHEFEDVVSKATTAFADQAAEMAKSLQDTMLTTIAALAGSILLGLFDDKPTPLVFVTGVLLYGIYFFVFPWQLNLKSRNERFTALAGDYAERRLSFVALLDEAVVSKIESERLSRGEDTFKHWLGIARRTYIGVFALLVVLWLVGVGLSIKSAMAPAASAVTPTATTVEAPTVSQPTSVFGATTTTAIPATFVINPPGSTQPATAITSPPTTAVAPAATNSVSIPATVTPSP